MKIRQMLYGATIALGAFLLFSVEPMAAKQLLPVLGGSSAVWLTCLFFFQAMLLLDYGYVYRMRRALRVRVGAGVHLALLGLGVASLALPRHVAGAGATANPATAIFVMLLTSIGVPFFLLGTTAPLLQTWFAVSEGRGVPYGFYALSNLSSLVALMSYPAGFEPYMTLHAQRVAWAAGFVLYAGLCGVVCWQVRGAGGDLREEMEEAERPALLRRVLWFLLPAVAAVQLCAVTSHLTANVAAIPLLWVVPLAVYLLSFVLAFEFAGLYRRWLLMRLLAVMLASLGYLLSKTGVGLPIQMAIGFFVVELFVACWFLHAELFALRPEGSRAATAFYLSIAAGGAAGTFFVAVVSPVVFRSNYDVPLAFAFTAVAAAVVTWRDGWQLRMLWCVGSALAVVLLVAVQMQYARNSLVRMRNFYGTLRVTETQLPPQAVTSRTLVNGSIRHGMQWFADEFRTTPLTYYAEDSGVGLAMRFCCGERPRRIGVVGLGAGTVAAYGRAGDVMEFYEINPLVEQVAREEFTYMRESKAALSVVPGDARVSLAGQSPQGFDVLVVDAFSGDAIPVHLLTAEALALYRRHMATGGVIAFHVSNQYLNLAPVLGRLAQASGMQARVVDSAEKDWRGEFASTWVLLSERGDLFAVPEVAQDAVAAPVGAAMWTDDYSSLLPLVRWDRSPFVSH